jgi:hypothetical protein
MPDAGDSGLYVYGVLAWTPDSPRRLPGEGMDGHPLEVVHAQDVGALVTEVELPRPPGRRRDLLSHSDVLNTVALERDVVPLRFGTVFPDADAVVDDLLASGYGVLTALIDRLAGAVQLNLRATYVEERVLAGVVRADPEIGRLRERTRDLPEGIQHPDLLRLGRLVSEVVGDMRREDSAMLAELVLPMVRETRVRERGTPDHVLDLALLVDRESVAVVEAELEDIAADIHERIALQLTGPLAPFDFVEEEPWD